MRFADTFGEHTRMTTDMAKAYCDGFQTTPGSPDGWGSRSVNTMVKHFPGGGMGEGGRDAHYAYGKYAVYPGGNFEEHLKPFTEGAFRLTGKTGKASAVMPYYTISQGVDQENGENVGNSYNQFLIGDCCARSWAMTAWFAPTGASPMTRAGPRRNLPASAGAWSI